MNHVLIPCFEVNYITLRDTRAKSIVAAKDKEEAIEKFWDDMAFGEDTDPKNIVSIVETEAFEDEVFVK